MVAAPTYIPTVDVRGFPIISCLYEDSHSSRCKCYLIQALIFISLVINDDAHFFMYLLSICMFSLEKYLLILYF